MRTFIRNVFTNIGILEQVLSLGKDISKAKVQCTNIMILKVQLFASISTIKTN